MEIMLHDAFPVIATLLQVFAALFVFLLGFGVLWVIVIFVIDITQTKSTISRPAVLALSHGAKAAGYWMNTGEGGLSPYHLEGSADIVFQIGTPLLRYYGLNRSDKANNT